MVCTDYISVKTKGNSDVIDITQDCQKILDNLDVRNGIVTVFNPGSTGGLTTIEYEPNLIKDFKNALELIAPSSKKYEHSKTWHDDNGVSHIRSVFIGSSITIPFSEGKLALGTWQQIIFCDFDTRPRDRRLIAQIIGE
ncbi:MAG: secondary thiamine-phosphate synthase enzyme YjbQ [Candidatus Omnitrophota bacterium]|nr:secondary thiamine-phosphate synthase enzyme YjbQ [Candidatus Omnitrophota bacterium]MBU1894563.1 secondary thiamine-phosphate synthase enzyme YjbQ [Candidatus Omnitrophota bacterium]